VWLVGTTVVRTLESAFSGGKIRPGEGWTSLFIRPGYRFHLDFNLITNFHLPRSSLIMLVAALLGEESVKRIYAEAIEKKYRFYSFGDAMAMI
jgi:S-adenosylmethionine:tRNA ribosyltransferase-isomerase